jgi:hypothetical protein
MSKNFFYGDLLREHESKPHTHLLSPLFTKITYIERTTKHFYTFEPSILKLKSKPGDGVVSLNIF